MSGFVARAEELADRYGDRFTPPKSLLRKAELRESLDIGEPDTGVVAAASA